MTIILPRIDELSVPRVMSMIKDDKTLKMYIPDGYYKKTKPDRTWLFNVVNTVYPDFLQNLVNDANQLRTGQTAMAEKEETILATDKWITELNSVPFTSRVSRL